MSALLGALPQKPWRVFSGNLTIPQLAAVIKHSALNFSGDTGTMHLAAMAGTPFVAWFWPNPGRAQWLPAGKNYRVIVGKNEPGAQFLGQIDTGALLRAAQSVLAARRRST